MSFTQVKFTGGEWSETAQGRMDDPNYKTAMSRSLNAFLLESGAWTRRPGFRYLSHTRGGLKGRLIAFDFTLDEPFQAELTDHHMRFYSGFLPVLETSQTTHVDGISTSTPARVFTSDALPASFIDGDRVVFVTDNQYLTGREFKIDVITTNSFDLYDNVTGDPIDGTLIAYVPPLVTPDTVWRIQDLPTPWSEDEIDDVRSIQNETSVYFFHGSHPTYILTRDADGNFSLDVVEFQDGPYMDPNTTTTTLTPSANGPTGITLTASSTTGINDDTGFQTTDIGRIIRVRGGFGDWSAVTTYATNAIVTGSDGLSYHSVKGGNLNHDPTVDDGTWWEQSGNGANWTYYQVVAPYVSTTVVNVERLGIPIGIHAYATWRLGLFSETTGYPRVGCFHEERLWLSGVQPNRVDGSVSHEPDNFEPTAADGTIADNSAVAAVFAAKELNDILWLLSTENGLVCGAAAGEWRVRASSLDDPISPTSIQARRVSTFGSAFVDPAEAFGITWVQTRQRKILSSGNVGDDRFSTDNLTVQADHVTGTGIVELRWLQEPAYKVCARRADGGLWLGAYKRDDQSVENSYIGWNEVIHGVTGRIFESISVGPSYDGLASALYVVTNQTDDTKPDFGQRWVEVIMPVLDSGREEWAAWFVDGGDQPSYTTLDGTTLTIGGFWHLEGYSIAPFTGGLDLGDYTVTNGEITVEIGTPPEFDTSFLTGLTDGTNYGPFEWSVPSVTSTPVPPDIAALTFSAPNVDDTTFGGEFFYLDRPNNQIVILDPGGTNAIVIADGDTGNIINTATCVESIPGTANIYLEELGYIAMNRDGTNSTRLGLFNRVTGAIVASYGVSSGSLSSSTAGRILHPSQFLQVHVVDGETFLISNSITGIGSANELVVLVPSQFALYPSTDALKQVDTFTGRTFMRMARGFEREERSSFYVIVFDGTNNDGADATVFDIYEYYVGGITITRRLIKSFTPANIDPLWTTAVSPRLMADPTDGTLVMAIDRNTGTGNARYLLKMDVAGNILWQVVSPVSMPINSDTRLHSARYAFLESSGGNSNVYNWDLTTGAYVQHNYTCRISPAGRKQVWDDVSASITVSASSASANLNLCFTMLGTWAVANNGLNDTNKSCRLFLGADTDFPDNVIQDVDTTSLYVIPAAFGVPYISRGQLLRPDQGYDAGARNGPAFGKKRRIHWWGGSFVRSQKTYIGTEFTASKMYPVEFLTPGETRIVPPTYYDGIVSTTVENDYSWNAKLAWEIRRPFPCTISALAGYIECQDK